MKKKLLLCFLLLACVIFATVSCDVIDRVTGQDGDDEHSHTGGIATCYKQAVCDDCGESYGEPADHSFSEATCETPKICTECRYIESGKLDHEYNEATCTEDGKCVYCGDVRSAALGHDLGELDSDAENHWRTCARCDKQIGKVSHSGGTASCKEGKTCTGCGLEYTEKGDHDWIAATCDAPKTCRVCGITEGDISHSYNTSYSHDDDGHWIECRACGDKKDMGEHAGGEATVNERAKCEICGARYGEYGNITIDWETEALLPLNGASVYLANDRIKSWYEQYDYTTTDTDEHWLEKDVFTPNVPVLKWKVGEAAKYYKVYVATKANLVDAQCYVVNLPELSVEHLYVDTTYYWYVDAVYGDFTVRSEVFTFTTSRSPRTVDIDGVSNSRDIGGYITVDGRRIKQGMIYRSAKLDDITELGKYTLVNILGVKTDLDLRGSSATAPVSELNHIVTACPWYSTGSNYIWMSEANKTEFANTIKVFADPDNYPIIFHCSLGRDRTGTVAMVLGGLLGLDENTLMMEYELSVFSYWGAYGSTKYNEGLRTQIHDTYLYIADNYEGDSYSEKVESFLIEIGVTADEITSIKDIMLEEVE